MPYVEHDTERLYNFIKRQCPECHIVPLWLSATFVYARTRNYRELYCECGHMLSRSVLDYKTVGDDDGVGELGSCLD